MDGTYLLVRKFYVSREISRVVSAATGCRRPIGGHGLSIPGNAAFRKFEDAAAIAFFYVRCNNAKAVPLPGFDDFYCLLEIHAAKVRSRRGRKKDIFLICS